MNTHNICFHGEIIFFLLLHESTSNEYHNICFRGEMRKISELFS